jgi:hypothetical protein
MGCSQGKAASLEPKSAPVSSEDDTKTLLLRTASMKTNTPSPANSEIDAAAEAKSETEMPTAPDAPSADSEEGRLSSTIAFVDGDRVTFDGRSGKVAYGPVFGDAYNVTFDDGSASYIKGSLMTKEVALPCASPAVAVASVSQLSACGVQGCSCRVPRELALTPTIEERMAEESKVRMDTLRNISLQNERGLKFEAVVANSSGDIQGADGTGAKDQSEGNGKAGSEEKSVRKAKTFCCC